MDEAAVCVCVSVSVSACMALFGHTVHGPLNEAAHVLDRDDTRRNSMCCNWMCFTDIRLNVVCKLTC